MTGIRSSCCFGMRDGHKPPRTSAASRGRSAGLSLYRLLKRRRPDNLCAVPLAHLRPLLFAQRPEGRSRGTSGRLKSGPTAAQPPNSSAAAKADRRVPVAPVKRCRTGSRSGGGTARGRLPRPLRVVMHPAHEYLVAQR